MVLTPIVSCYGMKQLSTEKASEHAIKTRFTRNRYHKSILSIFYVEIFSKTKNHSSRKKIENVKYFHE